MFLTPINNSNSNNTTINNNNIKNKSGIKIIMLFLSMLSSTTNAFRTTTTIRRQYHTCQSTFTKFASRNNPTQNKDGRMLCNFHSSLSSSSSLLLNQRLYVSNEGQRFNNLISITPKATDLFHRYSSTKLFSTVNVNDNNNDDDDDDKKIRVVFLGTPDVAAESLKTIVNDSQKENSSYKIVAVVTQPPKRRKRGKKVTPSPVAIVAEDLGISTILCPEKANDSEFLNMFQDVIQPDLCITAAYGQYLPKRFLSTPKFGTLNIHPSLLPRWRGASPVQRSLECGDNPVGVSVLYTVSKMDAGPIVAQETYNMKDDNENASTLLPQLFNIGTQSLLNIIPNVISGTISMESSMEQDEKLAINAEMIQSSDGELFVWKDSAMVCHNKVRGFSMWPGTFMYFRIGDDDDSELVKVKIVTTRVLTDDDDNDTKASTTITDEIQLGSEKNDGLRVVCGDGSILELLEVQPVTRKVMDAKSFCNGLRGEKIRWAQAP